MPQLRVVSYNVHGRSDDRRALAATVRDLAPDVLIVQEGPRRFRWRTTCADMAHAFGLVYASGGLPSLGNVILTSLRVSVHRTWSMRYPLTPGRHMRGAAFAECSVAGARFTIAGSHLATDAAERPAQARLLRAALDECARPLIVGADFNEPAGGAAWAIVAGDLADPGADRDAPTFPVHAPRTRIDGLLVDPALRVTGYDVVDSVAVRRASDHFPIALDVAVPDASVGSSAIYAGKSV